MVELIKTLSSTELNNLKATIELSGASKLLMCTAWINDLLVYGSAELNRLRAEQCRKAKEQALGYQAVSLKVAIVVAMTPQWRVR